MMALPSGSLSAKRAIPGRFQNEQVRLPLGAPLPRFGSAARVGQSWGNRLLRRLDFKELNTSYVNQIQLVYGACILWRLYFANERRQASPSKSWNEIRESALRDSVGYLFWFFATPMLQRGYLAWATHNNSEMKKALIQSVKIEDQGIIGTLKRWNPLTNCNIPSSAQVKDWRKQAMDSLQALNLAPGNDAYTRTEKYFDNLLKHRNLATGMGLLSTIALLGLGINYINILITRRNQVRRQEEATKVAFPSVPNLPLPPTAPVPGVAPPKVSMGFGANAMPPVGMGSRWPGNAWNVDAWNRPVG